MPVCQIANRFFVVLCLVGLISTNLVMFECFSTIHSEGSLVWTQSLIWRNKDYATWIHTPHAIVKFWRTSYSMLLHNQSHKVLTHHPHISQFIVPLLSCSDWCHSVCWPPPAGLDQLEKQATFRQQDTRFTTFIYFLVCYTMLYHWRFLLLVFKSFRFPVISSCFMPFHSVMSQSVAILKPGILLANLEMSAPSLFWNLRVFARVF